MNNNDNKKEPVAERDTRDRVLGHHTGRAYRHKGRIIRLCLDTTIGVVNERQFLKGLLFQRAPVHVRVEVPQVKVRLGRHYDVSGTHGPKKWLNVNVLGLQGRAYGVT